MKNQVKRWTTFALVMAMIFSVLTPVFAVDPNNVTLTGPVSLQNRSVSAYLLVEENDETKQFTTLAKGFFNNETLEKYGFSSQEDALNGLDNLKAVQVKSLASELKTYVLANGNPVDRASFVAGTTKEISSATLQLYDGYYIFVVPDAEDHLDVESSMTWINADNTTIQIKSDQPEVEKTVLDEGEDLTNADDDEYVHSKESYVGKIETYNLVAAIPYVDEVKLYGSVDGTIEPSYSFAFVDELTQGLALVDSSGNPIILRNGEGDAVLDDDGKYILVTDDLIGNGQFKVTLNGAELTTDKYTVTADENNARKFRVTITDLSVFDNDNIGQILKVEYKAIVTDEAVTDTPAGVIAVNNSYLEYEHNGDIVTSSRDTVTLLSVVITIDKWSTTASEYGESEDRGNGQYSLKNAVFQLYRETSDGRVEYYKKNEGTSKFYWGAGDTNAFNFTTNQDGQVLITQLSIPDLYESDTYYLKETKAPEGYTRYASPLKLVITTTDLGSDARTPELELTVDSQMTSSWTVSVQNEPEGWLPSTGSIGTYLFIAAGAALIIGATLLKKRPNSAK